MAARGCSKIWVSPAGEVEGVGLMFQTIYAHKLLADYLGITIDAIQIGAYKGAEEIATRDGPSPEARASIEGTLADMRETWLDGIKKGRPDAADGAAEDGPYAPDAAKAAKLVDGVGYADEAKEAAKQAAGAVREEVRFGPGSHGGKNEDFGDLLKLFAGEGVGTAPVALVRATGEITMEGGGGPLGGRSGISDKELSKTLAKVEHDDDVKALVLRIDSPGGSALASDLLWHDLMRIRKTKPIVVSIGEMAASGGYFLASSGSEIFADDASIVGSIGVVLVRLGLEGTAAKIGVHIETIPAKTGDPAAAARAAYGSPFGAWDDQTREKVRGTAQSVYDLFLSRIVEGRAGKITLEKLKDSAEGRIFSGRQGKERGLVDEIGGLMAAVAEARKLAGLPADARVAVFGEKGSIFDTLAGVDDGDAETEASARAEDALRARVASPLADALSPETRAYVGSFAPVLAGEHTLATMPYALVRP
jgi:protease-4